MIMTKNSAKAIIIQNQKVLLLKKQYNNGAVKYTLPGGTQEPGEALEEAVVREVLEEVAAKVKVKGLVSLYEHCRPSRRTLGATKHKVEFAFLCELVAPYTPQNGTHPDPNQVAVEWIDLTALSHLTLEPAGLVDILPQAERPESPVYLGMLSG